MEPKFAVSAVSAALFLVLSPLTLGSPGPPLGIAPRDGSGGDGAVGMETTTSAGAPPTCRVLVTDDYANAPVAPPLPAGNTIFCLAEYSSQNFMEDNLVYTRFCPAQFNFINNIDPPLIIPSKKAVAAFLADNLISGGGPFAASLRPFGTIYAAPSSAGTPRSITLRRFAFGCYTNLEALAANAQPCTIWVCATAQDGSQPPCAVFDFVTPSTNRVPLLVADLTTADYAPRFANAKNVTIGIIASDLSPVDTGLAIGSITACVN